MVKDLFIYLLLFLAGLVFIAESRLSLVTVRVAILHCNARASHSGGFACGAWAPGVSVVLPVGSVVEIHRL